MRILNSGLVCAIMLSAAALVASPALATTVTPNGTYDATNVSGKGQNFAMWLVGLPIPRNQTYWQFEGGAGVFNVNDTSATLSGVLVQNGDASRRLQLDMTLSYRGTGAAGQGSAGPKCGGGCADSANWDYFNFQSATLTGASPALAGLSVQLTAFPTDIFGRATTPGQLGNGANDYNGGLGFSTWFTWTTTAADRYFFLPTRGNGDININLDPTAPPPPPPPPPPAPTPIPLPASGLLLLGALGAAFARHRLAA